MADFDQLILDALNAGHDPQEIFDNFKNSKNPEKQKWYEQYSANMSDRAREPNLGDVQRPEPNVSTLDYISNLSPAQKALGVGGILAGSAALGAATYYGKKQIDINAAVKEQALKNQLPLSEKDLEFQRQNDISQRRLDIEERRVNGELASPELSPVERIRLEREQLKLQADRERFEYENQVRQRNILKMAKDQTGPAAVTATQAEASMPTAAQQFSLPQQSTDYSLRPVNAYGEQNINLPTGAPNVAVAPPAGTEPVAVQPKPVDPIQQAKLEAMAADQRRKDEAHAAEQRRRDEAHATRMANNVKNTEASNQKQSSQGIDPATRQMVKSSEKASMDKALTSNQKAVAKPIEGTNVGVAAMLPPETPTAPVAGVAPESVPNVEKTAAIQAVEESKDRIPSYSRKKNLRAGDVIGQGGWHWYQGQMGPNAEKEWEKAFGKTNQSYDTVQEAISSGKLASPVVPEGKKGGSFPREATVPHYIKGSASIKGMGSLAAAAAALGLAGSEQGQQAMEKAAKAIKDIGVSPDIFAGKGEEYGSLGRSYVNAGNPVYQRELIQKLESTKDPEFKKVLLEELQKTGYSGAGRGIAPPSAYQK